MKKIQVCCGKECSKKGSLELLRESEVFIREKNLKEKVVVESCACLKKCHFGPNIKIIQQGKNFVKSGVQIQQIKDVCKSSERGAQKKLNSFLSGGF